MNQRRRAFILVPVLTIICGLIIRHTIHWNSTGMYITMFKWLESDKGYLSVIYNVGFMVVLGFVLGLLMDKFAEILGFNKRKTGYHTSKSQAYEEE